MVHHRPESPSPRSPAVPPPTSTFASVTPPWRTGMWQGASHADHDRVPACHIGVTVGGGGFHTPKLPQYHVHASGESVPASPYSLPRDPDTPQPGSSAVLPRSGRPSSTSAVPCQGMWLPNSLSPMLPSHDEPACAPPETQAPSTPPTPCTGPFPSAAPSTKGLLPSSVSRTLPPTVSPPPGTGSRPYRLYSLH